MDCNNRKTQRKPKIVKRSAQPKPPDWESLVRQAQDQTRYAKMLLEKAEAHELAVKSMREIALKV